MARPKYKKGQARAENRLVDAFWNLLAQKNYQKISALEVCRESGLNKNTFYYHFSNMDDLAAVALDGLLLQDTFKALLSQQGGGVLHFDKTVDVIRAQRLDVLLSANGGALSTMLADRIAALWREQIVLHGEAMNGAKESMLAFASGGLVNAMRQAPEGDLQALVASMEASGFLPFIVKALIE